MTGYGRLMGSGLLSQPRLSASVSGSPDSPPEATSLCVYSGFRALCASDSFFPQSQWLPSLHSAYAVIQVWALTVSHRLPMISRVVRGWW
jgi:hypothetical protein